MIMYPHYIVVPSTQQPILPTHLAHECLALIKRIASNRCDSYGKTPTTQTRVGIAGRLVFCLCDRCEAAGTFAIDS